MRIRVVILEQDENYIKRLSSVFNNRYADKLEIHFFTEGKPAFACLKKEKIDVFLADPAYEIPSSELQQGFEFAYLADSPEIETLRGQRTVCKYQKAELIYKEILSMYSENAANEYGFRVHQESAVRTIAFLSPAGGVGTTAVAAGTALNLAKKGKKVLFVTMDPYMDTSLLFHGQGNFTFSDIIYAVKSKKSNFALKLESAVKRDSSGVYFFDAAQTALDLLDMKGEEMETFVSEVQTMGNYDCLILDMAFAVSREVHEVLKRCEKIVLVSDGTKEANKKAERAYASWAILDEQRIIDFLPRTVLIYNKFSNKTGRSLEITGLEAIGGVQRYERASLLEAAEMIGRMPFLERLEQ